MQLPALSSKKQTCAKYSEATVVLGKEENRMLTSSTWFNPMLRSLRNWKNCQYNVKLTYCQYPEPPLHYPTAADICKLLSSNSRHGATRKLVAANFKLVSSYIPRSLRSWKNGHFNVILTYTGYYYETCSYHSTSTIKQ